MNGPLWRTCCRCEVERGHRGLPTSSAMMSLGHIPSLYWVWLAKSALTFSMFQRLYPPH